MSPVDPLVEQATKLDPRARALASDPFASLPQFTHEFISKLFPDMSGTVVISYPSMGDMLEIERLAVRGRVYSEVMATLQVLTDKAPGSWYRIAPGDATPTLALGRLPHDPAIFDLYRAYSEWRDSFRCQPDGDSSGGAK